MRHSTTTYACRLAAVAGVAIYCTGRAHAMFEPPAANVTTLPATAAKTETDDKKGGDQAKDSGEKKEGNERESKFLEHDHEGHATLKIDDETREEIGLETVIARAADAESEFVALGRIEEDPARGFTLRAPLAGVLLAGQEHWPTPGRLITPSTSVGRLAPRFTALELIDLRVRQLDAQAEIEGLRSQVTADRASYESKAELNVRDRVVSERSLEDAQTKLKADEARLAAGEQKLQLLKDAAGQTGGAAAVSLVCTTGGEVIDVSAVPGEAVESGQTLLRIADFEHLLVRVELLPGQMLTKPDHGVLVVNPKPGADALAVESVILAPRSLTGGQTLQLQIRNPGGELRPGQPVWVHLPRPGAATRGVCVPRSALLRVGGVIWVYCEDEPGEFVRHAVELQQLTPTGWIVTGIDAEAAVVMAGAQPLLSEEMKSQIESEQAAGE